MFGVFNIVIFPCNSDQIRPLVKIDVSFNLTSWYHFPTSLLNVNVF